MPVELRLRYPPEPSFMSNHAALAVAAARSIDGITLDFTEESLGEVDRILLAFHDEGTAVETIGETVFALGAYVGEVAIRNVGGVWTPPPTPMSSERDAWPVVRLATRSQYVNPIGRAFKAAAEGEIESVASFYKLLVKQQ